MKHFILLAGLWLAAAGARAQNFTVLIECTPQLCGGFAQNVATLTGEIWLFPTGSSENQGKYRVGLQLFQIADKTTGRRAAYKTLDVLYGTLFNQQAYVTKLGSIKLDWDGSFAGELPLNMLELTGSKVLTGNFYINDPSVPNTQFVSGMTLQ